MTCGELEIRKRKNIKTSKNMFPFVVQLHCSLAKHVCQGQLFQGIKRGQDKNKRVKHEFYLLCDEFFPGVLIGEIWEFLDIPAKFMDMSAGICPSIQNYNRPLNLNYWPMIFESQYSHLNLTDDEHALFRSQCTSPELEHDLLCFEAAFEEVLTSRDFVWVMAQFLYPIPEDSQFKIPKEFVEWGIKLKIQRSFQNYDTFMFDDIIWCSKKLELSPKKIDVILRQSAILNAVAATTREPYEVLFSLSSYKNWTQFVTAPETQISDKCISNSSCYCFWISGDLKKEIRSLQKGNGKRKRIRRTFPILRRRSEETEVPIKSLFKRLRYLQDATQTTRRNEPNSLRCWTGFAWWCISNWSSGGKTNLEELGQALKQQKVNPVWESA
jgi:hypothetical protein